MRLTRYITYFDKDTEKLVSKIPLDGIDIPLLIEVLGVQNNDPEFYDCYIIDSEVLKRLKNHYELDEIQLDKYDYFIECGTV